MTMRHDLKKLVYHHAVANWAGCLSFLKEHIEDREELMAELSGNIRYLSKAYQEAPYMIPVVSQLIAIKMLLDAVVNAVKAICFIAIAPVSACFPTQTEKDTCESLLPRAR